MKPCSDCPFKTSSPIVGAPEWLGDVLKYKRADNFFSHTCHKTDPGADGYVGGKKKKECAGHLTMMFNEMDGTPGKGGVYESVEHLTETYLRHWLGDAKFEQMREQAKREGRI